MRSAAASLGVKYPVAVDDNYDTWDAYANEYWPADYLIDASGNVRHVAFGEGHYSDTESLIRQLLTAAHPGLILPPPTNRPGSHADGGDELRDLRGLRPAAVPGPQPGRATGQGSARHLSAPLVHGVWASWRSRAPGRCTPRRRPPDGPPAWTSASPARTYTWSWVAPAPSPSPTTARSFEPCVVSGIPRLYTLFQASTDSEGILSMSFSPGRSGLRLHLRLTGAPVLPSDLVTGAVPDHS